MFAATGADLAKLTDQEIVGIGRIVDLAAGRDREHDQTREREAMGSECAHQIVKIDFFVAASVVMV
jgi:hypothetical protein